jgi:hypothetical protein
VILLPFVLRSGQAGLLNSLLMVCGAGLPFLLVSATGMRYAPASAAGAVMVGSMPVLNRTNVIAVDRVGKAMISITTRNAIRLDDRRTCRRPRQ